MDEVTTTIAYKLENRNQVTTLFRIFLVIPLYILLATFTDMSHYGLTYVGVICVPVILTLLAAGKYPSYVYNFNLAIMGLITRVAVYASLLDDDYPALEKDEKSSVEFPDIDGGAKLNRLLPLVKWLISIPVAVVGVVYLLGAIVVWLYAWVSIIFTAKMPRRCAEYLVKNIQFWNRLIGYSAALVTDKYPSFKL